MHFILTEGKNVLIRKKSLYKSKIQLCLTCCWKLALCNTSIHCVWSLKSSLRPGIGLWMWLNTSSDTICVINFSSYTHHREIKLRSQPNKNQFSPKDEKSFGRYHKSLWNSPALQRENVISLPAKKNSRLLSWPGAICQRVLNEISHFAWGEV